MQLKRVGVAVAAVAIVVAITVLVIFLMVLTSTRSDAAILAAPVDRHVYLNSSGGGTQLNDCPNPAHAADGTTNRAELEYCPATTPHKFICDPGGAKVCKSWTVTTASCASHAAVVNGVTVDVDGDGTEENVYGHPQACVWNMAGGASDTCEVHAGTYTKPGAQSTQAMVAGGTAGVCARSECFNATFVAFGNGPNMGAYPGSGYGTASTPAYVRGAVLNGSTDTWDSDGDKIPDCVGNTGSRVCYDECANGTNPGSLCVVGGLACSGGGTCNGATSAYGGEPTSYPPIFDGDANGNGTFWESTDCTDTSCTGDTFYAAIFGCGHENSDSNLCVSSIASGQKRPYIDVNADGVFADATEQLAPSVNWNSSYLTVKDVAFQHYNGGPSTCGSFGIRDYIGHIQMSGAKTSPYVPGQGYGVDHVFWHDNFYSRMCADEAFTAIIGDNENHYSTTPDRLTNSFIISGNRFVINDDCGEYGECGGWKIISGNRIVFPARRADGASWASTGPGSSSRGEYQTLYRIKSFDTVDIGTSQGAAPKVWRTYNNEIIWQRVPVGGIITAGLFEMECFGQCWHAEGGGAFHGPGQGAMYFYGNLIRYQGASSPTWTAHSSPYCSVSACPGCGGDGGQHWKWVTFNNTWDIESPGSSTSHAIDWLCNGTGNTFVAKNNAYYAATKVQTDVATASTRANNVCSDTGSSSSNDLNTSNGCPLNTTGRSAWWTAGTKNAGVHAGLTNYIPNAAGANHPLDGTGSCDPDGDGVQGVDWDGNPATGTSGQETSWVDIAGNVVNCASGTQDVGAIQNSTAAACLDVCGDGIVCSSVGETCDDGSQAINQCVYGDDPPLTQVCNATCRGTTNCANPAWYGDGIVSVPEVCDGSVPPGTVCPVGCTGGAPACISPGVISTAACTGCGAASGTDRHVYLDTDGNGKLNQCPNPAHNSYACAPPTTPCRSDDIEKCVGGTGGTANKIRGDKAGYTTTCPAGAFVAVANGDVADYDADGVNESAYGHPQACVWNMAKSDSCEVHAGTYKKAGASCDGSCGDQSGVDAAGNGAAMEGTIGTCDKFDCFQSSIVALGDGPNLDGTGYGTSSVPGKLRGAQMNGSIDSWDPNGDKNPADGVYPAIISGDANANGAFDVTTCTGSTCSGDAFYGVIVGCGKYGQFFCRTTPMTGSGYVRIDSNADGTFDQNVGVFSVNTKEVSNLRIKDLEFTRYNGGNGAYFSGTRPHTGTIDLNGGDGSTNGLVVDHIYLHDNDFTYGFDNYWDDNVSNEGYTENHWAGFNDQFNSGCTTPTVIENSFLVQNNARLFNFDCAEDVDCGCETSIHDNRILVDVDPAKAGVLYRNNVEGGPVPGTGAFTRTHSVVVGYYKAIGVNPTQHRIWNNEFVIKSMGTSRGYFMDLQGFGAAQGGTNGSLWMYGNLFRDDPSMSLGMSRFWQGFCDVDSTTYVFRSFLNTYDMNTSMGPICSTSSGTTVVEKDSAYLRMTNLFQSTATTATFENNVSSTLATNRAVWFNPGSYSPGVPGVHSGLSNYVPRLGGPLYELTHNGTTVLNPCDPDRDGVAGANYYGAGNVTTWVDLAGNTVSCAAGTLSYGAVQPNNDGSTSTPAMLKDVTLKSAVPK